MKFATLSLPCLLLSLLMGCGSSKQSRHFRPVELKVAGAYKHPGTGMEFQEKYGEIIRVQITKFDSDESDVGLTYSGNNLPLVMSIFVYPAPESISIGSPKEVAEGMRARLFLDHFAKLKHDVIGANNSAVLSSDGDFELKQGKAVFAGKKAEYALNYKFTLGEKPSQSTLYLLQTGPWLVSYRVTYPDDFEPEFGPIVSGIMQSIRIPGPGL